MVKPLPVLAFLANAFFLASSTDSIHSSSYSSSRSSSSSHSSSKSESYSSSTAEISPTGPCSHGHGYQQTSSASVSSSSSCSFSSSSSSSSSCSSTSNGSIAHPIHHPDCRSCRANERWVACPEAVCVPKTCDDVGFPIPCYDLPPNGKCPGKPGCICEEGYVRNKAGTCVPMKQCPSCGGDPNAESGCGCNCNRLCSNYDKNVSCPSECLFNSCDCKAEYVYDEIAKKCVLPDQCTPPIECTKENEVYDPCPGPCPSRTCGISNAAVDCVPALTCDHTDCAPPTCRCKDGFYRNDVGECVLWDDCPKCNNPNEIYDPCPTPCPPQTCDVDVTVILCPVPPKLGDPECEPGCRCIDGYVRNQSGICIPKDECPPNCGPDEVYEACPPFLCKPLECSQVGVPVGCPSVQGPGCPGKPACICKDDYVRNKDGVCVPRYECPTCGGDPNKVAGCGVYCNQRCRDVGKKPGACILICYDNACDCREGYFLDENTDRCVRPKQCTPQCPYNERYTDCIQSNCSPQNCSQLGFPIPCPRIDPKYCKKGCLCKDGFVRNKNGVCIPSSECPSCGGDPNAQAGCGTNCNKHCSDVGKKPGLCILSCNLNGCDCKDGYYLDANTGFCVKPEQCTPQCPANEFYSECIQGNCSPQNCSQLGFPIPCPRIDPKYCKKGCLCQEGYVRNDKGICIPSTDCPSCGGDPNKVAGCGGYCNRRCSDIGKKDHPCILICEINGCDCKEGYYYDDNTGFCVKPEECTPQCPANEFYSECTQSNCSPQNCSQLGFPIPCPKIDPKYCKEGCLCNEGYVRNDKGVCIPSTQCPSCGGDPNAQTGCGINCNRHCSNIGKEPGACPAVCLDNGCDCKDGFFYDDNIKKCVKPKDCTPTCGVNEEYNDCINANCAPRTCKDLGFPFPCVDIDPEYCEKGCQCKAGYVRNDKGVCIPSKDCPSCGGDPNAQSGCGSNCHKKCSDVGKKPGICPLFCILNGCDCRDGYFFDSNLKKCVKPKDCTPICLDENNEVYSDCINGGCQAKNCSQYGKPIPCIKIDPKYCIKGCLCKEGYLRAKNGQCVLEKDCPEACNGPNEEYDECAPVCGPGTCESIGKSYSCLAQCQPMCKCKDGYYRNKDGICVTEEECKTCYGPNEEYVECTWNCPPETCESIGEIFNCPLQTDDNCVPMCKCKPGYFRNKIGICITEEQCKRCTGPHEYYNCGGACDNVCKTLYQQSQENCPIINIKCNEMCYCEKGYARARNNTCIPISCCDEEHQCPINERWEECPGADCEPQHCSELGFPIPCPAPGADGWCPKRPACVCDYGYVRNDKGICIPKKECPSCGGDPNAQSGCGVNCEKTCKDLGKEVACIDVCYTNACDCRDGYYYDSNQKKCVLPGECTDICGKNEVFEDCVDPVCKPKNCSELGFPLDCNKPCMKGCICKEGYIRNYKGRCIPINQCPSCGGDPNAESGCGGNCNRHCSQIGKKPGVCPFACLLNGCDCREGFFFDDNTKKCVKPENCTPTCLAQNNEVYSDCINGGCTWRNCSQYGTPVPCVDPVHCIKGCLCKDGYLRAANGNCIPEKDCPEACNGPNEEYSECSFDCPPQTCESLDRAYACPIREGEDCRPMCRCKPGYFRNKIGDCITEEQCRRCMGPHEFFSCGGACDNVCATMHKQNQTHCPIINIKCNERCYCEEGYARARNNTCIPIKDCKKPHQCPLNERWEKCPGGDCEPQHCSQLGYPIPCPDPAPDGWCPNKPGCVCVNGYVRNNKGKCIPKLQCPSCGGDCHAQSGCGVNCGKHCRDLGTDEETFCIEICYRNACDCKDGYYYDSNQKKCVLPGKCTDICGKHEVFEDCSNPMCRAQNCTQLGFPLDCDSKCKKGCVCQEGYARDGKGRCIPVKQCPSCGGDPHAETGCGVNCLKKCYDLQNPDRPRPCPKICKVNACDCREGYYLDENIDECVLPEDCSPICGKDEVYTPCANGGCDLKYCRQLGGPQLCIDPIECIEGCICRDGYLRSQNGTCVPYDQCPIPNCRANERFELCPAKVCQPQTCKELGFPIKCPGSDEECPVYPACICNFGYVRNNKGICRPSSECPSCGGDPNAKPGCGFNCRSRCPNNYINPKLCPRIACVENKCDCKDGFYYDINVKKCVTLEQCSPRCDELNHEVYDSCVNGGCGPRNCSEIGGPILCIDPIECKQGCTCQEGYYRLNNGTCVPEDQCPLNCRKPNEVYDPCPPICPPQTCESIGQKFFCPRQNATGCREQCRCKPGYFRNLIGECICKKNCLKCKGPHEYFSCGPACDNVCSKLDTESKDNCPIKNKQCVSRCYCEDGYARNGSGICIPIDECPGRSVNVTEAIAIFETGNQAVAGEFVYQLLLSRPNENFMVSGFSVLIALAQLALRAVGVAFEQLMHLLNLKTKDQIRTIFPLLIEIFRAQQNVTFDLAVKYYSNINYPFKEDFRMEAKDVFLSELQSLNFSQNVPSSNTINQWVSDNTNGLIKNLISPDMLSALTRCVLVNALYFKGNWSMPFNVNLTESRDFYIDNNTTIQVETMYQQGKFRYAKSNDLGCQILELPYENGNFTFLVMLPDSITGLPDLVEKLREPSAFDEAVALLTPQTCKVFLPRIKVETNIDDLPDLLKKLDVTEVFDPNSDGLKDILENEEPLYISAAIQKTYLIVLEEGTEAAAATAVTLMTRSLASNIQIFNANHPFAFFITSANSIVFAGCFVQ